jgi:tetratricopeptide (TPR) repeat protein
MNYPVFPFLIKILVTSILSIGIAISAGCSEDSDDQAYQVHIDRAKAYQDQWQYNAATIEYRNALQKSAGKIDVVVDYALMLNELGRFLTARQLLESVETPSGDAYHLALAEVYINFRKFGSAEKQLQMIQNASARKELLIGKSLTMQGKRDEALELYQSLLVQDSNNAEAIVGAAINWAMKKDYDKALVFVDQVPESAKTYPESQLVKSGIEIKREELEAAEATLTDLLSRLSSSDSMLPTKVKALESMSYVLTRLGRSNESYIYTKLLAEAFPGAKEAQAQLKEALQDFDNNDIGAAKEKLEVLLDSYPQFDRASQLMGIISYMEGDNEAASQHFSGSVDPEIANPLTAYIYAATNLKLNAPKKVLEILEPSIQSSKSGIIHMLYGLAAISDGQYEKGEAGLRKAVELQPEQARFHLALANYYRTILKDSGQEKTALDQAFKLAPTDRQVLTDNVRYFERIGQQSSAQSVLDHALKVDPDSFGANAVAGLYNASKENFKPAIVYLDKAISSAPREKDKQNMMFAKGRAALAANDAGMSVKVFTELVENFPASFSGYEGLYEGIRLESGQETAEAKLNTLSKSGEVLAPTMVLMKLAANAQDYPRVTQLYETAEPQHEDPDQTTLNRFMRSINYRHAVFSLRQNAFETARKLVAPLVVEEPNNSRILGLLIEIEIRSGNTKEAEKLLSQLAQSAADRSLTAVLRGDLALTQRNLSEAETQYRLAWEADQPAVAAEKLFRVLASIGDAAARSAFLTEWIAAYPGSSSAMLFVAMDKHQDGDVSGAQALYEKVLQLQPNASAALNNLGWIYFEKNDRRALALLEQAVEAAPENAAVLDSYGWALFKFGQRDKGLPYLEKALKLQPENSEIADHLAEAKKRM